MEWKVPAEKLGKFEKLLAEEYRKSAKAANREAAKRALVLLRERTRTAGPANPSGVGGPPISSGAYLRGWFIERRADSVVVGNRAPHAAYVEYGRRKGATRPPIDVLVPWVRRKLGVSPREARSVAFLVARAIGRRGLRGRFIATRALPEVLRIHRQALVDAIAVAMKKVRGV